MCAACGGISTWGNTWESRTLPDSMKKNSPLMGWVLFSFHLQRSSPESSLTERSTYLVRISAPAPCGRNRGPISPGRVRTATLYFSDCPNQCATLYLVRILTAARCAGFRQAKSPGRVGRCRIPWKKNSPLTGVGSFFISSATSLSQVVSNEVRECTWLGYRPPRPVGETGGRYHLGE